jgi:hypothetical protein
MLLYGVIVGNLLLTVNLSALPTRELTLLETRWTTMSAIAEAGQSTQEETTRTSTESAGSALELVDRSPVLFIENAGQWADGARFQVWGGPGGTTWLADDAIWITVLEAGKTSRQVDKGPELDPARGLSPEDDEDQAARRGVNIRLSFVGANPQPRIETSDRQETTVSYFYGDDPEQWRPDVPVWGGVRYVDLYPGIDLELTHQDGRLAPRLVARPGADLSAVQLRVEGADAVSLEGAVLRLGTAGGDYAWPLLLAGGVDGKATVQTRGAQIFDVSTPFVSQSSSIFSHDSMPDSPADNPADLIYATFLGGGGDDTGFAIAMDGVGNAYMSGITGSSDFPTTPGAFDTDHNVGWDTFVAKLNPAGNGLSYATFLGGDDEDWGRAIAVDGAGNAYVAGYTGSSNFPATPGAFDTSHNGNWDAFVVKLNPVGSGLAYATFLGGSDGDSGRAIAVDGTGSAYVAGSTNSSDFPTTPGAFDTSYNGNGDAFVAQLNPAGSGLAYATFLGGSYYDWGVAIALDVAGNAHVAGYTRSNDFPITPGAFDRSHNGDLDAFVAKLNPAGSGLLYATYLGGSDLDIGFAIAVDGAGSAYVTGHTGSSNFPTTPGAFDRSFNGGYDTFVAKLNPAGSGLAYATFLGGDGLEWGGVIAVDGAGSAYVTGHTVSSNFPTTPGAFDTSYNGSDAFAAKLNRTGSGLAYATFLGGGSSDSGDAIVVDGVGNAYITGSTRSSSFPTTPGAFDTSYNGGDDAFVAKLAMRDPTRASQYLPLVFYRAQSIGWEQEPNNTVATANGPLVSGMNYFGFPNDGSDYFFFQTTSRDQITIDLNNHTGQGIQLLLYYPAGNLVGRDIEPPYRLEYTGDPGRYYVRIYSTGGFNNTTPYTLRVVLP